MDRTAAAAGPVIDLYALDTKSHCYATESHCDTHMKIVALSREEWWAMAEKMSVADIFIMFTAALDLPNPPLNTLGYDIASDTIYVGDDSPKA